LGRRLKTIITMTLLTSLFHEPQGIRYHGLAVAYVVTGYAFGLYGLFIDSWWINLPAVVLLAHAMTIAAYMIHECGHNTVFRTNKANARLGSFLNWICGSSYGTYEDIRYKHFRHHLDNDDSVWFEYDKFFRKHPIITRLTQFFEWFFIPAHDLIMHCIMSFTSFIVPQRRDQRTRQVTVILIRSGVFLTVLVLVPRAAILYAVSYMLMMNILRFTDSLQHDYGANPTLFVDNPSPRFGGRETEQQHTFSNPLSLKYDWINWITLNFGFHNAHHSRPTLPWYRLPALHRELFGDDPERVIPFPTQFRIFCKYRVNRILHEGGDLAGLPEPMEEDYMRAVRAGKVYGGNAVSFLMSF
jgi:omega-6 fatty acid desaturase (delta-12 desaturase)